MVHPGRDADPPHAPQDRRAARRRSGPLPMRSAATARAASSARRLAFAYEGDVQKKDAYWAGEFFSIHMRIPDLYPKFVGHRRAWMYWAVNPDPDTRGVIIALNGIDEFMMLIKPKAGWTDVDTERGRALGAAIDRRRHPGSDHRLPSVDRRPGAGGRTLQGRPHHDRGRCRARVHADRRLRHEHRHRRQRQPGVEACGRAAGLGRPKAARQLPDGAQTDRLSQHRAHRASMPR